MIINEVNILRISLFSKFYVSCVASEISSSKKFVFASSALNSGAAMQSYILSRLLFRHMLPADVLSNDIALVIDGSTYIIGAMSDFPSTRVFA